MTKYRLAIHDSCSHGVNSGFICNQCSQYKGEIVVVPFVVTDTAFSDPIERADAAVAALDAVNLLIENHSDMYPIDSEAFGSLNALLDFTEASVRAAIEALPKAAPAITQGSEEA